MKVSTRRRRVMVSAGSPPQVLLGQLLDQFADLGRTGGRPAVSRYLLMTVTTPASVTARCLHLRRAGRGIAMNGVFAESDYGPGCRPCLCPLAPHGGNWRCLSSPSTRCQRGVGGIWQPRVRRIAAWTGTIRWHERSCARRDGLRPPPRQVIRRRRTYVFALEQAEQMFYAAITVAVATRPLQAFYGLSQAGRAAAPALTGHGWELADHGIRCDAATLRGELVSRNIVDHGGRRPARPPDDGSTQRDIRAKGAGRGLAAAAALGERPGVPRAGDRRG
jgi:hypothetical protein